MGLHMYENFKVKRTYVNCLPPQLNKMRVKGMNALFDVKFHVSVNDRTIVALATATGFFVAALPSPRPPKLQQARGGDEQVSVVD